MENDLNFVSEVANRSKGQTLFLFELCDFDMDKLKALEVKIKNCFLFYCPGDRDEVKKVMNMESLTNKYDNLFNFKK